MQAKAELSRVAAGRDRLRSPLNIDIETDADVGKYCQHVCLKEFSMRMCSSSALLD